MTSSRNRLTRSLLIVLVLASAGAASWFVAREAAAVVETQSQAQVKAAIAASGQDWAEVKGDGLMVRLSGSAPSEVDRFRASSAAATAVSADRIVDEMQVTASEMLTPPNFKIEILRNDEGISLIGLVPASTDRAGLVTKLQTSTAARKVTDLLESAEHPAPVGWEDAVGFAVRVIEQTSRAKISVEPASVSVEAVTASIAEKARLEQSLQQSRPRDVKLASNISAPRPVISPFLLKFTIDADGPRFDACSAETEEGQALILKKAREAGITGTPGCTLALGAPTSEWSRAAAASIDAVAAIGNGTVTLTGTDVSLTAPADVEKARFDKAATALSQALPEIFTLVAAQENPVEQDRGPAEFTAVLTAERELSMRGGISGPRMREAVYSLAEASFSTVSDELRTDSSLPSGWTVRVIAGLEALKNLSRGTLKVTSEKIEVAGDTGDTRAAATLEAALAKRLGPNAQFTFRLRYDRRLDPSLALPDGKECEKRMNIIMSEAAIGFAPNKASITGDTTETLTRLSEAMQNCNDFRMEVGGHTDSQGSEGFNAELSRARAQAVVAAMKEAGISTQNLSSRGYGESQPIASNDTDAGREENRRIEFVLVSPNPVGPQEASKPVLVEGATSALSQQARPDAEAGGSPKAADDGGQDQAEDAEPSDEDEPKAESPDNTDDRSSRAAPSTLGAQERVDKGSTSNASGDQENTANRPPARPQSVGTDEASN